MENKQSPEKPSGRQKNVSNSICTLNEKSIEAALFEQDKRTCFFESCIESSEQYQDFINAIADVMQVVPLVCNELISRNANSKVVARIKLHEVEIRPANDTKYI